MQLANSTTHKIISSFLLFILLQITLTAQENSAYSRYGLGDLVNYNNIQSRGMGSANIAVTSSRFVNVNNPASYAALGFNSGKGNGNLINFDIATEFNSRTENQKIPLAKYNTKNLLFNYMQISAQVGKTGNWGFNLGLLPLTRESYKIIKNARITSVDSSLTVFDGTGGAYKALIGTGYKYKNLSFGLNTGYLFGKKNTTTNLTLLSDSADYYESSSNTKTSYGNIFFHTGILYDYKISKLKNLRFGATYELQNKLNARQDKERLVYENDNATNPNGGIDSVFIQKDITGTILMPSSYNVGISYTKIDTIAQSELTLNADFGVTNWSKYRFYGQTDAVKSNYQVRTGLQWVPSKFAKRYWSNVTYRAGVNYGTDYINAGGNMPIYTVTLGLGLPVPTSARVDNSIVQPIVNLALEFGKRGNNTINLSENFVRFALNISLADIWFFRRKFD